MHFHLTKDGLQQGLLVPSGIGWSHRQESSVYGQKFQVEQCMLGSMTKDAAVSRMVTTVQVVVMLF